MHKIDTADGIFVDGTRRIPGTPVPAWWLNQNQNELINLVESAGLQPDKADHTQVRQAIGKLIITNSATTLASIDALRQYATPAVHNQVISVSGYYSDTVLGGGLFVANKHDNSSPDNGGTIVVDTQGTRWVRQYDTLMISDFGASPNKNAGENDAAIVKAASVSEHLYVPDGIFPMTTESLAHLKRMEGSGYVRIGGVDLPAGNITQNISIPYPSVFASIADIFAYLSTRSIRGDVIVTIAIAAGTHLFNGNGIEPYHPDGKNIRIIGAGSAQTTLKFVGLGAASSKAGVRLVGSYTLGLIDKLTLDGNNWDGHSHGGPSNGDGDPNDPMGIRAREGAVIVCGPDVKVYRFARNGVFAYNGATIMADFVTVTECGSDSFVASMASTVRARGAKSIGAWGGGFFANYGGVIWATSSAQAVDGKARAGAGGQGFSAIDGGIIHAPGAIAKRNEKEGFLSYGGVLYCDGAISGGGEGDGNGAAGLASRRGGRLYAHGVNSSHNQGAGIDANDGSYANVSGGTLDHNAQSGIVSNGAAFVLARSMTSIKNNGQWGIITRINGVVDAQGVSTADKIAGNTSGAVSGTQDSATGTGRSIVYINP